MTINVIPAKKRNINDIIAQAQAAIEAQESEELAFTRGPARRPAAQVADPVLQWASGLPTKSRSLYSGWLIEVGRNPDLDEVMAGAGFERITIRHGGGNIVDHWAIETANMFVIADGVQSIAEMRNTADRYGIAFGWRARPDGRQQSVLRMRVMLRELVEAGYTQPLLVSVKGTLTGDLLAALTRQFDVLDAIDAIRKVDGKPALHAPLYACSLPIGPGNEVTRGSGSTVSALTPMVAQVPATISREYVLAHWAKRAWVRSIEAHVDETVRWSVRASEDIANEAD